MTASKPDSPTNRIPPDGSDQLSALTANLEGAIFRYRLKPNGSDTIDFMSEGAESIWGLSAKEILGDPSRVWATVHPDDVSFVQKLFDQDAADIAPIRARWRVNSPKSLEERWLECRATPKKCENGDVIWDGLMIDVSREMTSQIELEKANEMLAQSQKLEVVGQLSGGIAHDFNNLLAVILGNAEVIQGLLTDSSGLDSCEEIIDACVKGGELTQRLLIFARKSKLDPKVVDLCTALDALMPMIRRLLPEGIEVVISQCTLEAFALVDVPLLESSIINLIINARDAMLNGGVISIECGIQEMGCASLAGNQESDRQHCFLKVMDNGAGIATEHLDQIKQPFFTTKAPGEGSGLGLAMVDGFMEQSGGQLSIESALSEGTTVCMCFPRVSCASSQVAKDERVGSEISINGRVLLVEDEDQVRLLMARHLRSLGAQVDAFGDSQEAMAFLMANTDRIALLVADVVMPGGLSGVELADFFQRECPDKPVLFVSGYTSDASTRRSTLHRETLNKPLKRLDLSKAINRLLRPS